MQARVHPMLSPNSAQPLRHCQSVGTNDALRADRFSPLKRRVDFSVGETVAYVNIDRADGNAVVVKFLLDAAEVACGRIQPPASQLVTRLFRAHAGAGKTRFIPDRM